MTKASRETASAAGIAPWAAAFECTVDALQRIILYLDVLRRRGNQYREHVAARVRSATAGASNPEDQLTARFVPE